MLFLSFLLLIACLSLTVQGFVRPNFFIKKKRATAACDNAPWIWTVFDSDNSILGYLIGIEENTPAALGLDTSNVASGDYAAMRAAVLSSEAVNLFGLDGDDDSPENCFKLPFGKSLWDDVPMALKNDVMRVATAVGTTLVDVVDVSDYAGQVSTYFGALVHLAILVDGDSGAQATLESVLREQGDGSCRKESNLFTWPEYCTAVGTWDESRDAKILTLALSVHMWDEYKSSGKKVYDAQGAEYASMYKCGSLDETAASTAELDLLEAQLEQSVSPYKISTMAAEQVLLESGAKNSERAALVFECLLQLATGAAADCTGSQFTSARAWLNANPSVLVRARDYKTTGTGPVFTATLPLELFLHPDTEAPISTFKSILFLLRQYGWTVTRMQNTVTEFPSTSSPSLCTSDSNYPIATTLCEDRRCSSGCEADVYRNGDCYDGLIDGDWYSEEIICTSQSSNSQWKWRVYRGKGCASGNLLDAQIETGTGCFWDGYLSTKVDCGSHGNSDSNNQNSNSQSSDASSIFITTTTTTTTTITTTTIMWLAAVLITIIINI